MDEKKAFSENLNYYMKRQGKTQIDIINDLGINKSTISTWCNGVKMPRMGAIQRLADYFGVKKSNLIEERRSDPPSSDVDHLSWGKPILNAYAAITRPRQDAVCTVLDIPHVEPFVDGDLEPKPRKITKIVYTDPAAAGVPLYAASDYEHVEFLESEVPSEADFGIRIRGDSMEPTIADGSIVWVRKSPEVQIGRIGVFMIDDSAVCKRFYADEDGIRLESDNEKYPPIVVREYEYFGIVGRVLGYR